MTGWWREWPVGVVAVGLVISVVVIVAGGMPAGGVLLACTVLAAGAFRLVLTVRGAGVLVVRSRIFDVLLLFTLGGFILLLSFLVTY